MGKQRRKQRQDANRPTSVNDTNWEWVARELYRQGKISAASLEGAHEFRTDAGTWARTERRTGR